MNLCLGDYILHFDDDMYLTGSSQDYLIFSEKNLDVLDKDKNILGINLLTMPVEFDEEGVPGYEFNKISLLNKVVPLLKKKSVCSSYKSCRA
jgi:hypothetical protein